MRPTRRGLTAAATTAILSAVASTAALGAPAVAAVPSAAQAAAGLTSVASTTAASSNPLPDRRRTPLPTSSGAPGSLLDRRVPGTARGGSDEVPSTRLPARGPITVMLELDAAPTSSAYVAGLPRGASFASSQALAQRGRVLAGQRGVRTALRRAATRGSVLYTTSAIYAGIAVSTDAARLPALGALPGVKAVHRITSKRLANSATVPLTGAPAVWAGGGTGSGMRVGIIDSGVDYTHADFGGPGTTQAYADARSAATQPPAYPSGGNVVGGVDLAGDAYDPGATLADGAPDAGRAQPQPDANPVDCEGHGTHVAGTAAGLGVTTGGATYRGPYTAGLRPADFRIGPGVAPGATVFAIKVFGCTGSTDLVSQALDWSADPNRDGDVSDHLDVVNLSLGGDFASPQDPDSVAADNLARLGTVVVAAAGNAGDVQDAVGSPADSVRSIAVAASDDAAAVVDGLKVEQPADLEPAATLDGNRDNVFGALQSSGDPGSGVAPYDWAAGGLTGAPMVTIGDWAAAPSAGNNPDGCDPYAAADAATVAGKVVLLQWTDTGPRRCGSGARGAAAFAAGASGVVLADDVNSFSAGIAGDPRLPMMLVVKQGAEALKRAVDASRNDGSVRVTLTSALHNTVRIDLSAGPDDPTDRIASFSSRGFGTALAVKPDLTAPGVTVFSADVGTGADGTTDSGTSMASPHVAGVAALVRAAHPSWSVEQIKAAILGTAGAPVRAEAGGTAPQSPARAGVGRVQADEAVRATTLAYDSDVSGAVNLSFGDVAVTADTTVGKGLTVQNTSSTSRRYRIAYRPGVTTPGVAFTVSPSTVLVPARSSVKVLVSMRLTPAAMRRTGDPSASTEEGLASYYTDAGGAVTITPTDGAVSNRRPVAVAVYAAPRPASDMTAAPMAVVGSTGNGVLPLSGAPLLQGSGSDPTKDPTLYASTVSALMLAATSPQRPDCTRTVVLACTPFPEERSGDLRYVGVASDVPYTRDAFSRRPDADSGYAFFGVAAWGPWRTPASYAEFDVYIDTDAGSPTHTPEAELVLYNSRLAPDSDIMVATLADLRTGTIIDQEPLNGALGSLDTGLFHSDSMILPLWLPLLTDYLPQGADGRPSSTRVGYWVQSGTVEAGLTDAVGSQQRPLSVDLRSPALRAAGDSNSPVLNSDAPRSAFALAVRRDLRTYAGDAPRGLLLIHHQNLNQSRAQVVSVRGFSSTALRSSAVSLGYGGRPVLTATVRGTSGAAVTGTVTFRDGSTVLGTSPVRAGVATLRPAALPRGTRSLSASYGGSGLDAPSASPALRITVAGSATTTSLRASDVAFRAGGRPSLTALVAPSSSAGTVVFRDGDRVLGRAPLVRGRATLRSPALARGTHTVRATYEGSVSSLPSTSAPLTLRAR